MKQLSPRFKLWLNTKNTEGVFGDGKWRLLKAIERVNRGRGFEEQPCTSELLMRLGGLVSVLALVASPLSVSAQAAGSTIRTTAPGPMGPGTLAARVLSNVGDLGVGSRHRPPITEPDPAIRTRPNGLGPRNRARTRLRPAIPTAIRLALSGA